MMNNPLISVIVPVYKVEKYLKQCVDSILNQSFTDFELILVDDGSPDGCPIICDEYAKQDKRIKVIHKHNGGSSSARKAGISSSVGRYVMFIDGDDWLDQETLLITSRKAMEIGADCVMFSYVKEYEKSSTPVHIYNGDKQTKTKNESMSFYHRFFGLVNEELQHPELADSIVSCCMKLYKREFVLQARYFDTKYVGSCEDGLFNIYALYNSAVVYYLDDPLYHYRKTNSGSLTSLYRPLLPELWGNLFKEMQQAIIELSLPVVCEEALKNRIALSIVGIGFSEIRNPNKKEIKLNIKKWITSSQYQEAIRQLEFKFLPFKWKVFLWFCKKKQSGVVYLFLKIMYKLKGK